MKDYENDFPIDDAETVLDLLLRRRGDATTREIVRIFERRGGAPYIEIGHHADFADSIYKRFLVTARVADALLDDGCVGGKPEWGRTDMARLSITDHGERRIWDARQRVEADDTMTAERWIVRTRLDRIAA